MPLFTNSALTADNISKLSAITEIFYRIAIYFFKNVDLGVVDIVLKLIFATNILCLLCDFIF